MQKWKDRTFSRALHLGQYERGGLETGGEGRGEKGLREGQGRGAELTHDHHTCMGCMHDDIRSMTETC